MAAVEGLLPEQSPFEDHLMQSTGYTNELHRGIEEPFDRIQWDPRAVLPVGGGPLRKLFCSWMISHWELFNEHASWRPLRRATIN